MSAGQAMAPRRAGALTSRTARVHGGPGARRPAMCPAKSRRGPNAGREGELLGASAAFRKFGPQPVAG